MTQSTCLSPLILLLVLTCTITSAIPILTPSFDTTSSPGPESYPTGNILTETPLPDPDTSSSSTPSSSSLIIASINYQPDIADPNSIGEKEEKKEKTETSTEPAQKVDPLGELIKDNPIPPQEVCCQTNKNGGETCWSGMFIAHYGSLALAFCLQM